MIKNHIDPRTAGEFTMHFKDPNFNGSGFVKTLNPKPVNTLVYNPGNDQSVVIDEIKYGFPSNSVVSLVASQHFVFEDPASLISWQFDKNFYCILDHDLEVGCVGFLFYGIESPVVVELDAIKKIEIERLINSFESEWDVNDSFQSEMFRILLKQLLINVSRIAKDQSFVYRHFAPERLDLVRKFSLLVEGSFKREHSVEYYANAMHKSSKTLSNTFAILKQPSPSTVIKSRILKEAQRYLLYSDLSAKEIGNLLGFETPAHFSRFFKINSGTSLSDFRKSKPSIQILFK